MKKPLVILTIFYCWGISLAGFLRFNFWLMVGLGVVIFIFVSSRGSLIALGKNKDYIFSALLLLLVLVLGVLNLKNSFLLPNCHIRNFVHYPDNSVYSLRGFVASAPEVKDNYLQFIFDVREIQQGEFKWRCCGKVMVRLDAPRELNYGDNLLLIGNLARPYSFSAARGSYKDFLQRQGVYLIMRIKDLRRIIRQPGNSGSFVLSSSFWLRARMEQVIRQHLAPLPASILSAMVLGQKRGIPWLVNNTFVKSGTVHILVVSGFNVGIVIFIMNLLFKIVRIPRKVRIVLVVICLLSYCLITGSSNPVVRATVMGVFFLSAYFFKRAPDIYNTLALAALVILIIKPGQFFDIGFQLSFISVLAIVYLYPKLEALICLKNCRNKIWRFICQGCLVSFSAWLGTLGIIAFNFGIIAPVTVLANILIVPLATLITLCGFTLVLSGLIYPGLAALISAPTAMLINLLLNINAILIKLPFAYIYL